jgi:penicillin V acylase-like amidase (Ntn superfamily)
VGDPQYPHLAPTYWRSVADSTDKVYYFESTLIGNIHANLAPVQPIGFLRP